MLIVPDSPYRWTVAFEGDHVSGFAYRPGEVLVQGAAARDGVARLVNFVEGRSGDRFVVPEELTFAEPSDDDDESEPEDLPPDPMGWNVEPWFRLPGVLDVPGTIRAATAAGFTAEPNYVFFADSAGCENPRCPPHPSLANDLEGLLGNPFKATPFKATPFKATPFKATPFKATAPTSSAVPAPPPAVTAAVLAPGASRVVVFDTGIALVGALAAAPFGAIDAAGSNNDVPDKEPPGHPADGDGYLDPVAGHGTFIAGLIDQRCPGTPIKVRRVIEPTGDVDQVELRTTLRTERIAALTGGSASTTIFSISASGYVLDKPLILATEIALCLAGGIVVVASAGNDASCRPSFPAAFPGVVSVGALGPCGPAEFTNYGTWVRACAPGVDLVSRFFTYNGKNPSVNGVDPDDFEGWAMWSGTSFAAPVVVAALIRHMVTFGVSAQQAVADVIDAPQLARIPYLGTIVNL